LIRPGRVDKIIKFDYPRKKEINDAFNAIIGDSQDNFNNFYKTINGSNISMAGLVDYLFRHPRDYLDAVSELNEHTTSYRGFNINKLKNFNLGKVKAGGYSFFMETIYRLKLGNFSMVEMPIIFNDRIYGQSKIPKIEIFRTLFNLIKILLKKSV
jgi:hypothetical protein